MTDKWRKVLFSDLADVIRGVSYKPEQLLNGFEKNVVTLLRATNLQNHDFFFNNLQFVPKEIVLEDQLCRKFDMIMCMSNGSKVLVGKNAQFLFNPISYTCGAFCSIVRSKKEYLAKFIFTLINSHLFQKQLDITLSGTAINNLQHTQLNKFYFFIPDAESTQHHIAEILTTCDEVIAQTEKAIEKYRNIKAGMMQDLFTRGLDDNGKLRPAPEQAPERYKDSPLGKIPIEWEIKKVGEIFDIEVGGDLQLDFFSPFKNQKYKYPIFSNSLESKGLYGYTSEARYSKNSITITGRGSLGHAEYRITPFDAIIRLIVLKPKSRMEINCSFITEQINFDHDFFIESTGVPQLTAPQSAKIKVRIPNCFTEQNSIADCLSSLDTLITAEEQTLAKYRAIKLGLMKRLLTPPEGAVIEDETQSITPA